MHVSHVALPTPTLPSAPTPVPDVGLLAASGFAASLRGASTPLVSPRAPGTVPGQESERAAQTGPLRAAALGATTLGQMLRVGTPALPDPVGLAASFATIFPGVLPGVLPGALPGGSPGRGAFSSHAVTVSPVDGAVSSGFGDRVHPITGERRDHDGLDIAAPTGTPVRSITDGVVVSAGDRGGYGLLVEVDHGDGTTTRYAHLSAINVAVGDRVGAGATVGAVGSTGNSTGPHLHVEVRVHGESVDPDGAW